MIPPSLSSPSLASTQHHTDTKSASAPRELKEAAREFEAALLREMLQCLEKTTKFGEKVSAGQSQYGSMVVDTVADAISKSGGVGLSQRLVEELQGRLDGLQLAGAQTGAAPAKPVR